METQIGVDESVSAATLRAVSAIVGRLPGSLGPLSDVVDPAALDALGDGRSSGPDRTGGRVTFVYHALRITVHDGERITLEPVASTDGPAGSADGVDRTGHRASTRDTESAAVATRSRSPICDVCQRPIVSGNVCRERGELVHDGCRAERRCSISFGHPPDR